jgi:hypothetical protein
MCGGGFDCGRKNRSFDPAGSVYLFAQVIDRRSVILAGYIKRKSK